MASNQRNQTSMKSSAQIVKEWMGAMEGKLPLNQPAPSVLEQTAFKARLLELLEQVGEQRFVQTMSRVITECTFFQMPAWKEIESRIPERRVREDGPFQPPTDPVTQEQLDKFNSLVRDIAEGKMLAKREPKDRQELHEKISKGMKVKLVDRKAEAANDK